MNTQRTFSMIALGAALAVVPGSALAASAAQGVSAKPAAARVVTGTLKSYRANHTAVVVTKNGMVTLTLTRATKLTKADSLVAATPKAGNAVAAWTRSSGALLTATRLRYGVSPFAISSQAFRGTFNGKSAHKFTVKTKTSGLQTFRVAAQTQFVMRGQRLARAHFVANEPLKVTEVSLTNGETEAGEVSLDDVGGLPKNDGKFVVGSISSYTAASNVVITTATGDVTVPLDANTQLVDASGGTNAPAVGDSAAALLSSHDGPGDGHGDGGDGGDNSAGSNDHGGGNGGNGNKVAALLQFDATPFAYASEDVHGDLQAFTATTLTIGHGNGNSGGGDARRNDHGGNKQPLTVGLDANTKYMQDGQATTTPTFMIGKHIEATANVSTDGSLLATTVDLPDGSDNGGTDA